MINYIVCLDNEKDVLLYGDIIKKYMKDKNINYKIIYVNKNNCFDLKINGNKIYFFDCSDTSIDIAKKIRCNDDWNSQIIISLDNDCYGPNLFKLRKMFMLDILIKDSIWLDKLQVYLDVDFNIINNNRYLCFKYCNELYRILYNDICYIEKNLCNNDSTIYTKDKKYLINLSINKLMDIFNCDSRFYKCHRSCIINLENVISYDISNNIVKFDNMIVSLVSRDRKKELEKILFDRYY